jgi:SAM-dependent methyltransferase
MSFLPLGGSESMNADGQWQLTGNAAELYESVLVPRVFQPWAADLVELADLRHGERVLDVACGTGVVARLAAQHAGTTGEITGLDLNAGMLLVARSLPAPPGAPVTWVEASALAMPLRDASFDVVLCQQGFQFFPDKRAGLQEARTGSGWAGAAQLLGRAHSVHRRDVGGGGAARVARGSGDAAEKPPLPGPGECPSSHGGRRVQGRTHSCSDPHEASARNCGFRVATPRGHPSGRRSRGVEPRCPSSHGG